MMKMVKMNAPSFVRGFRAAGENIGLFIGRYYDDRYSDCVIMLVLIFFAGFAVRGVEMMQKLIIGLFVASCVIGQ